MGNTNRKNRHRNRGGNNLSILPAKDGFRPSAVNQPIPIKIGIEQPPNEIYKYRQNRIAPANDIWGTGTVSYMPDHGEYIEGVGTFVHYSGGVRFPSRCVAPVEAIYAVNGVKRIMINAFRFFSTREAKIVLVMSWFMGKKRRGRLLDNLFKQFTHLSDTMLQPYYLKDGYYCPLAKEIRTFVRQFLLSQGVEWGTADKTGEIVGMMFEYDNAYRFRLNDLLSEASKERLLTNFPAETLRLLTLEAEREKLPNSDVTEKFRKGVELLRLISWIPSIRRGIEESIDVMDFEKLRLEEGEIYHTLLFGDYDTQGKTLEERFKIYEKYHGEDRNLWPMRMMTKSGV